MNTKTIEQRLEELELNSKRQEFSIGLLNNVNHIAIYTLMISLNPTVDICRKLIDTYINTCNYIESYDDIVLNSDKTEINEETKQLLDKLKITISNTKLGVYATFKNIKTQIENIGDINTMIDDEFVTILEEILGDTTNDI